MSPTTNSITSRKAIGSVLHAPNHRHLAPYRHAISATKDISDGFSSNAAHVSVNTTGCVSIRTTGDTRSAAKYGHVVTAKTRL